MRVCEGGAEGIRKKGEREKKAAMIMKLRKLRKNN